MAFNKIEYKQGDVLTSKHMNEIQDEILSQRGQINQLGNDIMGCAPDGHGLGRAEGKSWSSIDTLIQPGWYSFYDSVVIDGYTFGAAGMRVDALDENSVIQTIHPHFTPMTELKRHYISGVWYDWEWVNPPMHAEREYRTTERHFGKPVYVQTMNCGQVPAMGSFEIPHGISCRSIIGFDAYILHPTDDSKSRTIPFNGYQSGNFNITAFNDVFWFEVDSESYDYSGYHIIVTARYVK